MSTSVAEAAAPGAATVRVRLLDVAHARSGDKGDTANVGVIALRPEWYPLIERHVTRERVAEHFRGVITGDVVRYGPVNRRTFSGARRL